MHYKKVRPHTIKNLSVNSLDPLAIGAADRGEYRQAAGAFIRAKNNRPTEFCVDGPLVANGWLELLLFSGVALHVKIIAVPRLTSHLASVAPRLPSLVAAGAPRLTPVHTGRCWSGWRWSGWRWSSW